MNCLSKFLISASTKGRTGFHPKIQSTRLTHLSFADDILFFIDGSLSSVQNVLQVLHDFDLRSGLAVSVQKSSFFSSGLSQMKIDQIQASTGMSHWSLITCKIFSVFLCLSIAGITNFLVLFLSASEGISFLLPKACVNRINSLWCVLMERQHRITPSSKSGLVKKEGGLGLIAAWSKATCLKLIWLFFFKAGFVWVAWYGRRFYRGT